MTNLKCVNNEIVVQDLVDNVRARQMEVDTVDELTAALGAEFKSVFVRDPVRGGDFIFNGTGTNDGGTIFNGWHRQHNGTVTAYQFGAKGDGITDDIKALQNGMAWSAMTSNRFLLTGGNYKIVGDPLDVNSALGLPTASGLYMEWTADAWILPAGRSRVGAILTNVLEGDIPGSLQENITLVNPQMDLINMPTDPSTPVNDNAIGFARGAKNIVIKGGYIKNVSPIWMDGISGTGGKGVNFEHGVFDSKIEGTITFENCFCGLYLNGVPGTSPDGYDTGVSNITVDNVMAIGCDTAVTLAVSDFPNFPTNEPETFKVHISSIVFKNCGYAITRPNLTAKYKSGAIVMNNARNVSIGNITGFNDALYAQYSTISDTSNIGYGLSDGIGAVIYGNGNNIDIGSITYNGIADAGIKFGVAAAVGGYAVPSNQVNIIESFRVGSFTLYNNVTFLVAGDGNSPPTVFDRWDVNINYILGSGYATSTITYFCDTVTSQQTKPYITVTNLANGSRYDGKISDIIAKVSGPFSSSTDGMYSNIYHNGSEVFLGNTYLPSNTMLDGDRLVDYGTNVNGHWWKYAGGLLVCKHQMALKAPTIAVGAIFSSDASDSWTYPVSFANEAPAVSSAANGTTVQWVCYHTTQTYCTLRTMSYAASTSIVYSLVAVGTWK